MIYQVILMESATPEEAELFISKFQEAFKGIDYRWMSIEGIYQELLEMEERNECDELAFQTLHYNRELYLDLDARFQERCENLSPKLSKILSKTRVRYFDWDCRPIMHWEYAIKTEYFPKHVGEDVINGWIVSTVWMGLNHAFFSHHPPLIFETMMFKENKNISDNDELEYYQERYSYHEEAIQGHKTACELVKRLTDIKTDNHESLEKTSED